MDWAGSFRWLFDSERGASNRLVPRWLFLRALGLIYFSAFFSLLFQIRGLIGPQGILPANEYLQAVARRSDMFPACGTRRLCLWFSSGSHMLMAMCWVGMVASSCWFFNLWPRGMLLICFVCFLSFVSAAQDFSGYQSDGMLLEAGFISLFFAAAGFLPGLGRGASAVARQPVSSALGVVPHLLRVGRGEAGQRRSRSGATSPPWTSTTRTARCPPGSAGMCSICRTGFMRPRSYATLALELGLVWMLFSAAALARLSCFFIVTPWQIGVILTANYTFLNYLVLVLGLLLLRRFILLRHGMGAPRHRRALPADVASGIARSRSEISHPPARKSSTTHQAVAVTRLMLIWIFYATTVADAVDVLATVPFPISPVAALEPFRIANRYGLFAVMTRGRYEIEFQGSDDGQNWTPYPFRYKPQDSASRREFTRLISRASTGTCGSRRWERGENIHRPQYRSAAALEDGDQDVLALFAGNPFPQAPPRQVRAVLWQYWFTSRAEKQLTGAWWRREMRGLYAPTLEREADGKISAIEMPDGPFA